MATIYRFSGHESFPCKTLWLKKGYDFVVAGNQSAFVWRQQRGCLHAAVNTQQEDDQINDRGLWIKRHWNL